MSCARTVALAVCALLGAAGAAGAATPKEIEAAIRDGAAFLKTAGAAGGRAGRDPDRVGATALVGLALLEAGTPADDPAVRKITARVRDASYTQTQTYQLALCVLYLDRHGDPADRALVQMLGVRLLVGQRPGGGWTYGCVGPVPPATERLLRTKLGDAKLTAGKPPAAPAPGIPPVGATAAGSAPPAAGGKLYADVERYRQELLAAEPARPREHDDNSNTQFGVLGLWVARRHGLPAAAALELVERRFVAQQGASGGWPYAGPGPGPDGTPSMTCAGLIALATAVGRREERVLRAEPPRPHPKAPAAEPVPPKPAAPKPPAGTDPDDPFYNPPPPPAEPKPDPPAPKGAAPARRKPRPTKLDEAIERGMDHLGDALAGRGGGRGARADAIDLYFLWSLERVGVIYGADRIGKTDWYEYASDRIVRAQNEDGSWGGRGGYGPDVDTAFALLVLSRSNLARDLSRKVQAARNDTELRAGAAPGVGGNPEPAPKPDVATRPEPIEPELPKPGPAAPAAATPTAITAELFRATGATWAAALARARDAKGVENTSALLAVLPLLDGDRKKEAREALAERLCRMSAASLRGMLAADEPELRRAAALACAMKDDKGHVPDLVGALADEDGDVVRAARAGLKSLTGQDFGPAAGAPAAERVAAVRAWREWLAREKK